MSKVTDEMVRAFNIACWDRQRDHLPDLRAGIQALFDAKLISLPVDEAVIRESVVREAIAMFEYSDRYHYTGKAVCENLRSILTPKDRAEELHKEWVDSDAYAFGDQSTHGFARWLIEREGANG